MNHLIENSHLECLNLIFENFLVEIEENRFYTTIICKDNTQIIALLDCLKQDSNLRFTCLIDLFAVDFPSRQKRFEIVYSLLSFKINKRIIIKLHISEETAIESVTNLFAAANWYEREMFDLYGIIFNNHPDLRRILTDYGFIGHPLRKDFPLVGHVEVIYDEILEKVKYVPVKLDQEYRHFDFLSPWEGPNYPGRK